MFFSFTSSLLSYFLLLRHNLHLDHDDNDNERSPNYWPSSILLTLTKQTIDETLALGFCVKMVTGDQLAFAKETGRHLGLGDNMYS